MPVYVTLEVVGLKEALKELNSFDKSLRRQITRDYKQIMQPIEKDAKAGIKAIGKQPMSGWSRSWNPANKRVKRFKVNPKRDQFSESERQRKVEESAANDGVFPWNTQAASRMIKAKINTRQPREFAGAMRNLQVFTISWLGAADEIFEMAGRETAGATPQGRQMIRTLNERFGKSGRILWNAYDKNRNTVDKEMRALVERVMAAVNRKPVFTQTGTVK